MITARRLSRLVAVVTALGLGACSDAAGPEPVAEIVLTAPATSVIAGQTLQLTAVTRDEDGEVLTDRTVTWSSASEAIARVSASGLVTGVAPGSVVITARSEGAQKEFTVAVLPVPVASVTVTPQNPTVRVSETTQLAAETRDANGAVLTGRMVTWSSSDLTKATVSATGVVTGVAAGTATITATSEGRTGTTTVTVTPGPVASVTVAPQNPSVREGATLQLTATTRDASGAVVTGRMVTWTSSNTAIATVSGTGMVTGVAPGTATITATSEGRSGTTTVTVLRAQVVSIRFAPLQDPFIVGDTVRVRAVAIDSLGRELPDRTVTYTSSNNAVATVTTSGLATGTAPGTVTFTATSEGVSGTQVGTVRDVRASFGSLACQGTTVGRSCTTSATLRFADNNNIVPGTARVTTIESSNPSIARVENITYTQAGGVTTSATLVGVSPGTVTITARYSGLNGVVRTDSYTFTVSP
jgi:uncharacterized protein YjdB